MAKKKLDPSAPFDAGAAICPLCLSTIHVYVPPDRNVGGGQAYPALLLHFEVSHEQATPPPPPEGDEWTSPPPPPEKWVPFDKVRAAKGQAQPAGVWPPVLTPESPE